MAYCKCLGIEFAVKLLRGKQISRAEVHYRGLLSMRCSVLMLMAVGVLTLTSCAPNSPSTESQRARVADGARVELRDSKGKSVGTLTVAMYSGGGVQFTGHLIDL